MLHGFWAGFGMWNATFKSKLIEQLTYTREAVLFEVFLDLHKEYDDLDWDRWIEILVAYRVGPRTIRILWTYWDQMTMVSRVGRYFGLPFKEYRRVTEVNPLTPTLINMVMDAVMCYWVKLVAPTNEVMEGLGLSIRDLAAYFYAIDEPRCLDPSGVATEGVRRPHQPLYPGRP